MPVTALDPTTALLAIDLQKGIAGMPTQPYPAAQVVERAAALAHAFRERGLPVVLVNVAGGAPGRTQAPRPAGSRPPDWTELVPELNRHPSDLTVTKHTWGAFVATGLEEKLRGLGVTQVVICGIATSMGVESTARQAYELGFNVTLAVDAMSDRDPDVHANSVERVFPKLGETGTVAQIRALLDRAP